MNIQEFMKVEKKKFLRPQIICKDGTRLSVQASSGHYCSPRMDDCQSYFEVEVGYPSIRPPKSWKDYSESDWNDVEIIGRITRAISQIRKAWRVKKDMPTLRKIYTRNIFTDSACDTIYAYIPISLVDEFIESHGGIDEVKTFGKEN